MRFVTIVLATAVLAACSATQSTDAPTWDDVARAREEGFARGYERGVEESEQKGWRQADRALNEGWESGNAYTCNTLYGYGEPDDDGWRLTVENYGQDAIAHKVDAYYWSLGAGEVPHRVTREMCLAFTMP